MQRSFCEHILMLTPNAANTSLQILPHLISYENALDAHKQNYYSMLKF